MHWIRIAAFACMLALPLPLLSSGGETASSRLLPAVWQETGALLQQSSVRAWVKLPAGRNGPEAYIARVIASQGGSLADYQLEEIVTDSYRIVRASRSDADGRETIAAVVYLQQQTVYMTALLEGPGDQLARLEQRSLKILSVDGAIPRISACLSGWINGKLSNGEWDRILSQSFAVLAVKAGRMTQAANLASASGYSPLLPAGLDAEGELVNFQLASRYNRSEHRTYITLGTPVIAQDY